MRKIFLLIIIIFISSALLYSERYEPILGRSGSVIDFGGVRFPIGWTHRKKKNFSEESFFNFGIDFGIGLKTELQNRIGYNSDTDRWMQWTELLKFLISESQTGPAIGFGLGARVPLNSFENLGLMIGLYISSAIKDIDFDFNIGINPFITYKDIENIEEREHNANLDFLLGKKVLSFMKICAGFEMLQYFGGKRKIGDIEENLESHSDWTFILGLRLKPKGYPILLDNSLTFGINSDNALEWQYKVGLQILPQSPNADW